MKTDPTPDIGYITQPTDLFISSIKFSNYKSLRLKDKNYLSNGFAQF